MIEYYRNENTGEFIIFNTETNEATRFERIGEKTKDKRKPVEIQEKPARRKRTKVTPELQNKVIELLNTESNISEIMEETGLSRNAIKSIQNNL